MPDEVPPDKDIGPFYRSLSVICVLMIGIALFFEVRADRNFSWPLAVVMLGIIVLVLALIRPDKFDTVIKDVATKLPFVKYDKDA